jgi:hypothetical protein
MSFMHVTELVIDGQVSKIELQIRVRGKSMHDMLSCYTMVLASRTRHVDSISNKMYLHINVVLCRSKLSSLISWS